MIRDFFASREARDLGRRKICRKVFPGRQRWYSNHLSVSNGFQVFYPFGLLQWRYRFQHWFSSFFCGDPLNHSAKVGTNRWDQWKQPLLRRNRFVIVGHEPGWSSFLWNHPSFRGCLEAPTSAGSDFTGYQVPAPKRAGDCCWSPRHSRAASYPKDWKASH